MYYLLVCGYCVCKQILKLNNYITAKYTENFVVIEDEFP